LQITADGQKAGGCVDLPIGNGAVDDKILLGPDAGDAVPEQRIEVDVAVDHGVLRVMPDDAAVAVIFMEGEMALQLQTCGDLRNCQFLEWRVRHDYPLVMKDLRGVGEGFARLGSIC